MLVGVFGLLGKVKEFIRIFHLGEDPREQNDHKTEAPEIAAQLSGHIEQWRRQIPPPVTPRKPR